MINTSRCVSDTWYQPPGRGERQGTTDHCPASKLWSNYWYRDGRRPAFTYYLDTDYGLELVLVHFKYFLTDLLAWPSPLLNLLEGDMTEDRSQSSLLSLFSINLSRRESETLPVLNWQYQVSTFPDFLPLHSIQVWGNMIFSSSRVRTERWILFSELAQHQLKSLGFTIFPRLDISQYSLSLEDGKAKCLDWRGHDLDRI